MPSYRYTARAALARFLTAALLFAAAAMGLAVLAAAPASAHDSVESTSPSADASLPAPPEKVSITLSNNPLAIGTQIKVTDAAGTDWADGDVQIVDNVASQPLRAGAPAGRFTVQWRVASSDGHPIEGTFGFSAAAPGPASAAAPGAATAGTNTVPTMGTAEPGSTVAAAPVKDASEPFPWSIVIFVAVAIGILVALGLMAKRRLQAGDDDQP